MLDLSKSSHQYLRYLEIYMKGDLESFHQKCNSCEDEERKQRISMDGSTPITSSKAQGSYGPAPTSSTSTTPETTRFPSFLTGIPGIPKYFRSTIPHTLTLFAALDTLGFLFRDKPDFINTSKNFNEFLDRCSRTKEEKAVLLKVYRHGMMHGYFPKLGLGISYHSGQFSMPLFFKGSSGSLVLNVNELERIVILKLDDVIANPSTFPFLDLQYQILEVDYERDSRQLIEDLEKQIP